MRVLCFTPRFKMGQTASHPDLKWERLSHFKSSMCVRVCLCLCKFRSTHRSGFELDPCESPLKLFQKNTLPGRGRVREGEILMPRAGSEILITQNGSTLSLQPHKLFFYFLSFCTQITYVHTPCTVFAAELYMCGFRVQGLGFRQSCMCVGFLVLRPPSHAISRPQTDCT